MSFTQDELQVLEAAATILDRHMRVSGASMKSPKAVRQYLRIKLEQRESEVFAVMFLNTKHKLIEYRELFFGTIDGASVYPREVVKAALEVNAGAVILVHNHPSGDSTPSMADIALTGRLRDALALVDVRLLDHFVVGQGRDGIASLAELGHL